ncbi:unnamed protein product [Peniophora sp. CBMAI 1063]|nr:unnamed protein product [Peniophora sp. CBMAI 1063]
MGVGAERRPKKPHPTAYAEAGPTRHRCRLTIDYMLTLSVHVRDMPSILQRRCRPPISLTVLAISIVLACVLQDWHPLRLKWAFRTRYHPNEIPVHAANIPADTTAIVLNWSRFSNVRRIAKLLCAPELAGVFQTVLIWNNHPKPVFYEDFDDDIGCLPSRLHIVNSPENLYFQARFMACMSANTTFCYTQDDDYLVLPETLQSLHARISESNPPQAIHLLPPHERLSSELRYICNEDRGMHASFAWLGHGAILHRSLVEQFLELMHLVNATEEQLKMADNYFSILSNWPPELWFDQGIELGGGQAFTVGSEGELRNRKHITYAGAFLDSLLDTERDVKPKRRCDVQPPEFIGRAPCIGRVCLLETSVQTLPSLAHTVESGIDMLANEERSLALLHGEVVDNYLTHPPSNAVDAGQASSFRSLLVGKKDDYMMLDILSPKVAAGMTWLVDEATALLLQRCTYESSIDGKQWSTTRADLACIGDGSLFRCAVPTPVTPARYFRVRLQEDVMDRWTVYDVRLL